ncbi:unnamed protein product [Clonostachys rosea]|uniref:Transcription factor domain-containing protein n=1 Tax=Bionectria ochroleuca TaxID=29856 RepID=A0ABY6TXG1_BIOOC|nr:unnamed protein product [Clonostachys rosea]
MAEEGAVAPLVMPVAPYDDMNFGPESQIIIDMMTNDETSAEITVDKIVAITSALATTSSDRGLEEHASNVSLTIVGVATRVPHDQQSKLVDFCFRLHLYSIPDPINGGFLSARRKGEVFWSEWPQLKYIAVVYGFSGFVHESFVNDEQSYQNYMAWRAQLSEMGFSSWKEDPTFTWEHLKRIFRHGYGSSRRRTDVRAMCMWLIYAPNKVWLDVQLRRRIPSGLIRERRRLRRSYWSRWKEFLRGCHEVQVNEDENMLSDGGYGNARVASEHDISDRDTQELIKRALESMEMVEAEHSIRSG